MKSIKLSLVIPCYNEALNIPHIIDRLVPMCRESPEMEVILVDNGSTDETPLVMRRLLAAHRDLPISSVQVSVNQGYGHGILAGLEAAKGDVLAWTHADLQTCPKDALRAYHLYRASPDEVLVKGRRVSRSLLDTYFTKGMEILSSLVLRTRLSDINAQPKVFSRRFYDEIKDDAPDDFSLDLYVLYQARKQYLPIMSVDVRFDVRQHGEAKGGGGRLLSKWPLICRTFTYIFKLRKRVAL